MNPDPNNIEILVSAIAADTFSEQRHQLIDGLAQHPSAATIAQKFGDSKLIRELRLTGNCPHIQLAQLSFAGDRVIYESQDIGKTQLLYKSPLPGELQARLSIESIIERFLEYLQKQHQIALLHESDFHIKLFIPKTREPANFKKYWREFIETVAFSIYGNPKLKLSGLAQTFITMLKSVTLSGRGFSTLEVPIITRDQSTVLAAWYLAVIREVEKRQSDRQVQIERLAKAELSEKEQSSKQTDLNKKEEMQRKESEKYRKYFQKGFGDLLEEQQQHLQDIELVQSQIIEPGITKAKKDKLQKQYDKVKAQILLDRKSLEQKKALFEKVEGDPFRFVRLDREENPKKFKGIVSLSKLFTKTATDQINSTRGDIFTQCILEMYRLLENEPKDLFPEPLLNEQPQMTHARSPGDDNKEFCYSCGVALDPKINKWKVARFMFERPSQRRQSASSEDRPPICSSCSVLAFASPLKVTDESIIIQLKTKKREGETNLKIKDYVRMLTIKSMNLYSGRYMVLVDERTMGGDFASQKLGKTQYAMAKVSSIFPKEVLSDFEFYLIVQGSQKILFQSRHLILIQGLMRSYAQSIIVSGKEINIYLGEAIRYVEQDLPYLGDYTLAQVSSIAKQPELEQARCDYWEGLRAYLTVPDDNSFKQLGDSMSQGSQSENRAKLYEDVAALTGLTYPFVAKAKKLVEEFKEAEVRTKKKGELTYEDREKIKTEVEREVSKIIENVHNPYGFAYFAAIGDRNRTIVEATLYRNRSEYFIYDCAKNLLCNKLDLTDLKESKEKVTPCFLLHIDDLQKAYQYFAAQKEYESAKGWKELTYNLKLSLYTRFPNLIRKLKHTSEE